MQSQQTSVQRQMRQMLCICSIMALCAVLSACNFPGSSSGTQSAALPVATATPTVDPTLQAQGTGKLQTFQQWISLIKQYGGETATYQQQYDSDQQALRQARTSDAYTNALTTLNGHVTDIQIPAMKAESQNLQQKLQQEVSDWGQQHKYHNDFDHTDYPLGYEYADNGIGGWVQDDLSTAKNVADYQQAIENINMYLTHFQAYMTNSSDKTPYDQSHATDIQLLQADKKMDGKAVVVSLSEQAMRVYDHGKLVKAFLVTTGRPNKPSIPGDWWVEGKQAPTTFKAGVPKSDPNWYPDTPINFAMQYHSNGYFIHDSWWRSDYGPGTNYPHADSSGDPFSAQGSHGCVNISKDNAGWLYNFVVLYTPIIIY